MNKDCKIKVKRGTRNTVGSANKLLIVLFAGFISVFFLLIMFLPKHEGELSPNERRVLASAPNTSLGNILSGKFSGEVDTWMEDHFPARNAFVSIYSHMNLYSGRSIVEKVTLGKNNRLFSAPVQRDDETMKTNAEKISGFITENDLNAFTFIIPSAICRRTDHRCAEFGVRTSELCKKHFCRQCFQQCRQCFRALLPHGSSPDDERFIHCLLRNRKGTWF